MSPLLNSPVCDLLGCRIPIILAGMGGVSRAELVAAVSEAGGFGFLGMVREDPALIVAEVEQVRGLGHRQFGVNIIPTATEAALLEAQIKTCIELRVPVVGTFWDLDELLVERLRRADIMVVHQVGSVAEAMAAERAGVQIIIAQGTEAGGHVRGTEPLRDLLPAVAAAIEVPVLAAGGLATGSDLVTALALGAQGVVLGTAMITTHESFAHAYHKQRLLTAVAKDTLLTTDFHINWPANAPVRVLSSAVTIGARGHSHTADRTVIGEDNGRPIFLFSTDSPLRSMTGDYESMALYAGAGVGQFDELASAGDRLRAIVREAETWLAMGATDDDIESSSPVCYTGEMAGAYMGHLSDNECARELEGLADDLHRALCVHLATCDGHLPFVDTAPRLAGALLLVRRLAASRNRGKQHWPADLGERSANQLPLLQAAILGRLRAILPQVPECTRDRLMQVLTLVGTDWPGGVRSDSHSPLPDPRSNESLAASDR